MIRRSTIPLLAALAALAADPLAAQEAPDTLERVVPLPEVVVSTARPGAGAPLARTTLDRDQIRARNWGQDTPMALAGLPGVYAYSDAGNGIGYSYLSIRGFPQRRISVLVNGVPLNDPQSHEVYWIDHPDLLASASEVQVQRGVGSALYGAASVGGSVHIETAPFAERRTAAATLAYGTHETKRLMLEAGSGELRDGWNFHGRYSRIESSGYRFDSWSRLWSYAFAARRAAGAHTVRAHLYGGPEETRLAYLGVPRAVLEGSISGDPDRDRRVNPIEWDEERDHFFEPHYELIHSWRPRPGLALSHTLFWFDGKGWYDERRSGRALAEFRLAPWATTDSTLLPRAYYRDADGDGVLDRDGGGRVTVERFDPVRRRTVANRQWGWVPRARIEHPGGALTLGGELRAHDGRRWGQVTGGRGLPPDAATGHVYYDYHPRTLSAGLFAREEWSPRPALTVTADLAWRHQRYAMRGDRFDGVRFDQSYDFALPRLGLSWRPDPAWRLFGAVAHARREPAFRDLYDAEAPGTLPLYRRVDVAAGIYQDPLVRPERVLDWEAGAEWSRRGLQAALHLYRMDFRDELVIAGQFDTDLGYPILGNAARSVHQGVELAAAAAFGAAPGAVDRDAGRGAPWLALSASATLSDHRFVEYREAWGPTPADVVSHDGNRIGFFPAVMAHGAARGGWGPARAGIAARHVGRIHLDATERVEASIGPHAVLDLELGWEVARAAPRLELGLRVLNLLDRAYESGGYMDVDAAGALVPHYIPAAQRTVLGELRVEF